MELNIRIMLLCITREMMNILITYIFFFTQQIERLSQN